MLLKFYVLFVSEYTSVMLKDEGIELMTKRALFWLLDFSLLKFNMGVLLTLITYEGCDLHLWIDLRCPNNYSEYGH